MDFPTKNPYQSSYAGNGDAFVFKLAPTGNTLVYSTYLGGAGEDKEVDGIAVDVLGCAYVTGRTGSSDFPIYNAVHRRRKAGVNRGCGCFFCRMFSL
jgi:hypothetical protein